MENLTLQDWGVILGGFATFGGMLWSIIVVPLKGRHRHIDSELSRLEDLIVDKDTTTREDFSTAISEAIEKVGAQLDRTAERWASEFQRHVEHDEKHHTELHSQNRTLIAEVGKLQGLITGMQASRPA